MSLTLTISVVQYFFFRATINCSLKSPTALRKVHPEGTEAVFMGDLMANFLQHPALISVRATPSLR